MRDDRENSENPILIPMPEEDAKVVEQLYQKVLYASSTTANEDGLESILKEEVDLEGGNYKAMVKQHDANTYIIKKIPAGWGFGRSYDLQRGYGEYTVEGEKEEMMLGPVRHLVFVIHGVGEVMWNRDGITEGNLTSEVATLRLQMQKRPRHASPTIEREAAAAPRAAKAVAYSAMQNADRCGEQIY